MLCGSVPSTRPSAPVSRRRGGGLSGAAGCCSAPRRPLPPFQLSSAARSGTGANRTSASSKGFLGAANRPPSAALGRARGGCGASRRAEAGSSLSSGAGRISLPAWRSPAHLPPGAWPAPGRRWSRAWLLGAGRNGAGQLETHLRREAGVSTGMLPGPLGMGLLGPQWLGRSSAATPGFLAERRRRVQAGAYLPRGGSWSLIRSSPAVGLGRRQGGTPAGRERRAGTRRTRRCLGSSHAGSSFRPVRSAAHGGVFTLSPLTIETRPSGAFDAPLTLVGARVPPLPFLVRRKSGAGCSGAQDACERGGV